MHTLPKVLVIDDLHYANIAPTKTAPYGQLHKLGMSVDDVPTSGIREIVISGTVYTSINTLIPKIMQSNIALIALAEFAIVHGLTLFPIGSGYPIAISSMLSLWLSRGVEETGEGESIDEVLAPRVEPLRATSTEDYSDVSIATREYLDNLKASVELVKPPKQED